jgi:adenosine deaminase
MPHSTQEFIRKMPKSDLHLHLDGSLRLSTLIEIAQAENISLPSFTEEGLNKLVFKKHYKNLEEYLCGFSFTVAALQTLENLERVAYELAKDSFSDGVRYIEVRFAPQLHAAHATEICSVVQAVNRGLERAKKRLNANNPDPLDLPFEYGIILCALRRFNRQMSPYYERLLNRTRERTLRHAYAHASFTLAKEAVKLRDTGLPVVGFDLAGEESGYPAVHHKTAFQYAHRHFLHKTVHAGEAYGPESIFQALTECHANRIGHGTFLFSANSIQLKSIKDPDRYVEQLTEYIANKRITIEVCPTSNLQTIPNFKTLNDHPIRQMLSAGLSVSIATDNRLISHTTLTRELQLITKHLKLNPDQLRHLILTGFKHCFFSAPYKQKQAYIRHATTRYDQLASQIL